MIEMGLLPLSDHDADFSIVPSILDSDLSDNYSESTLSRCNSLERLKLQEGFVEESFRVDRRKLEAMILGCPPDPWDTEVMKIPIDDNGRVKSAIAFFEEIMEATKTIVKYPKYLKIGARNKKDPHVRVIGKPEAVSAATRQIRHELQPNNRITMKVDVPWNCHSHIIGKGGNTIQPVVKRTGVSIHFPDGNKNSEIKKSNQVSINSRGEELTGLEEARSAIRLLTPLIFTFSLPATAQFISILDTSLLVCQVQNTYNVQAEVQLAGDALVGYVKGTEWDATRVKEATLFLLRAICGNLANQMTVQITMEISPQHHSFILGRNFETLRKIMQRTATKIKFPDNTDPNLSPLNRSTVKILGGIENVYLAKQNIIGSLPLMLMFDTAYENWEDQRELNQIMQTLDVNIFAKPRRPDGRQPVIIRAAERNASNIYEAWRIISRSEKSAKAKIPGSYLMNETPLLFDYIGCASSPPNCSDITCNQCPPQSPPSSFQCCNSVYCNAVCSDFPYIVENGTSEYSYPETVGSYQETVVKCDLSPGSDSEERQSINDLNYLVNLIPDRRAPGWEKKHGVVSEYLIKKMMATRLMKAPISSEPRTPTSDWSGFGLSKSQPFYPVSSIIKESKDPLNGWTNFTDENNNEFQDKLNGKSNIDNFIIPKNIDKATSNYFDSFQTGHKYSSALLPKELNSLLAFLQLEQYIDLFSSQYVDYDMFCQLNDQDLKDLGVTVFGHRKKLMTAIKELSLERKSIN